MQLMQSPTIIIITIYLLTITTINGQRRNRRYRLRKWLNNQNILNNQIMISNVGKWRNGVIYYQIRNSLRRYTNLIEQAFQSIESQTCIQFKPRNNERDYIILINGDGCHSKVGRTGGPQIISLGDGCHDVGSVIHELCHAIGLYHEHMRYDRDQYLNIIWRNIQPSMYSQFQKVPITQYHPAGKFDYNSIMIYGTKAFSRNQRFTMLPLTRGIRIKESHFKHNLSKGDVININALYGCNA